MSGKKPTTPTGGGKRSDAFVRRQNQSELLATSQRVKGQHVSPSWRSTPEAPAATPPPPQSPTASNGRLKYIERSADKALRDSLHLNICVGIFEPARRGKTCLVEHLAGHGYRYLCVGQAELNIMLNLMNKVIPVAPNTIGWDALVQHATTGAKILWHACVMAVSTNIPLSRFLGDIESGALPSEHEMSSKKFTAPTVIHFDNVDDACPAGAPDYGQIRRSSSLSTADAGVALALIAHHFCVFARVDPTHCSRLVFSGVDLKNAGAVNTVDNSQYDVLRIPPLDLEFAKKVLAVNVVMHRDDAELEYLRFGSVAQLVSTVKTRNRNGTINAGLAYNDWSQQLLDRHRLEPNEAIAYLALLSRGSSEAHSMLRIPAKLSDFPFLSSRKAGQSTWTRLVGTDPLVIERPSTWHCMFLGSRAAIVSPVFERAFQLMNARAGDREACHNLMFIILCGTELCSSSESPMFTALGVRPTVLSRVAWIVKPLESDPEPGVLYLSDRNPTGDLFFLDGEDCLAVVKCSTCRTASSRAKADQALERFEEAVVSAKKAGARPLAADADPTAFRFLVPASQRAFPTKAVGAVQVVHDAGSHARFVDLGSAVDNVSVVEFIRRLAFSGSLQRPPISSSDDTQNPKRSFATSASQSNPTDESPELPMRTTRREAVSVKVVVGESGVTCFAADIAPMMRTQRLPKQVDGLKLAVLGLPVRALQGKFVEDLEVFPPGTTLDAAANASAIPYGSTAEDSPGDTFTPLQPAPSDSPYLLFINSPLPPKGGEDDHNLFSSFSSQSPSS